MIKWMPFINYFSSGASWTASFKPGDVKDNKIELPLFRNVGLDYKVTGEMSKHLNNFKIIEHGFNMYIHGRKKPQQYLWKAIWYFSDKPKTGDLKIKFK